MSRLKDHMCRARWFANRGRYGEAVATLETLRPALDASDVYDVVHYYGFLGGFRLHVSDTAAPAIDDLSHSLILAHKNNMPDNLFIWLVRYNLGLAMVLPHARQREKLEEAVEILGTAAEALRLLPTLPNQHMRSGTALALLAETLLLLGRNEEAAFYASEALPRLSQYVYVEPVVRRMNGCYGILKVVREGWDVADSKRFTLASISPPGEINRDEADNYRTVPQPPADEPA